jgi:UDP-galactopyranose mutase
MNVDILCFCHLRWNFVYQRPQHLLSRFARTGRVFVVEEPIFDASDNHMEITVDELSKVWVVVPHLKKGMDNVDIMAAQQLLLNNLLLSMQIRRYIAWYYSPMALGWSDHLTPQLVVYDCMDELSAFKFAPSALAKREQKLLKKADIVFTGGQSLYEAKKHLHNNIHPFPSSIDKNHFSIARTNGVTPVDQQTIPHPRIGFYGVLDERLDTSLIKALAALRPQWHFVLIGPVVKIDRADLPQAPNIHYLGSKPYNELPHYLAGWDMAMMPFALNESTRFISPTKTPEYLAGGKPVIATPIHDVVNPYGLQELVHIVQTPEQFIAAATTILTRTGYNEWLAKVDAFLANTSWDKTWERMASLINEALKSKFNIQTKANECV